MDRPRLAPSDSFPRLLRGRESQVGWWVLAAIALVSFSRVAFFNPVLGVFVQPLEDEFGWSRATIAGALSVGTIVGALLSPLIGPMVDRHGGRAFMVGGVVLGGVLLILLQGLIFRAAFAVSPASAEVEAMARSYMGIRVWSAPAAISSSARRAASTRSA